MLDEYFLKNLQFLMDRENLNQVELGKAAGLKGGTVSNWFQGKNTAKSKSIELLASFFNVKPYYFFMEPGTQNIAQPSEQEDDFKTFLDEIVQKRLCEIDQKAYHDNGGANQFVKVMRGNYESDLIGISDWYLALAKIVAEYASFDLVQKIKDQIAGDNPKQKDGQSA